MTDVAIIGGGPAGLIAAERLAHAGLKVTIFDRMPSLGRKMLMAGRGGLNLTHSEPLEQFLRRYGAAAPQLTSALREFPPDALRSWAEDLGEATFVGSSGRVFPHSFKASPLLRAVLRRLDGLGVEVRTRHVWHGWTDDGALLFGTGDGSQTVRPRHATLLALGGASWPKLGSDGSWLPLLAAKGAPIAPLEPANAGVRVPWTPTFSVRFAGTPVKRIGLTMGSQRSKGEMIVTEAGLEGGAIYALSAALRSALAAGPADLAIDLKPDVSIEDVERRLSRARPGETASNLLRKALALSPVQIGLLREACGKDLHSDPAVLSRAVKCAVIKVTAMQGLDRAISTAGGLSFSALDESLMLLGLPGTFAAGEMLNWEAPTGGYLLQACFATGVRAAQGILSRKLPM